MRAPSIHIPEAVFRSMLSTARKRVLVVDDEASVRESLRLILSRLYEVDAVEGGEQALTVLDKNPATEAERKLPDIVLLDVMMPGIDGIDTLRRLRERYPAMPVVMLTASGAVRNAVQAMKFGAVDYLSKPFDVDELLSLIDETIERGAAGRSAPSEVKTFEFARASLPPVDADFGAIVGDHPLLQEIYRKAEQLAERDTTVLITGESGTGKELIAREIHRRSRRAAGPFIAINCAAIPESLIESEIFGHEKGSFTHASERRIGYFELAHGGTLLLDEIGELSLPVQVKILRFLQEQEFYRVGRSKPIKVDVRILAATNRNLEGLIAEGKFRQDLYYRINVVSLEMPPLRERSEDVRRLAQHFIERLRPLYGNREVTLTEEALRVLERYSWPGNVRELENVVESMLALVPDAEVGPSQLPSRLWQEASRNGDIKDDVLDGKLPFEEAERAFETDLILKALQKTNFIQTRAAELLGISRRILKYKMDKLGIPDKAPSEDD